MTFKSQIFWAHYFFYQNLKELQNSYIIYIENEERKNRIHAHAHGQEVSFLAPMRNGNKNFDKLINFLYNIYVR